MESRIWEAYPSSTIKSEDIEMFLNSKSQMIRSEVFEFINSKGYFKYETSHKFLKTHPKWRMFIKHASDWIKENEDMKKKIYDEYHEEAIKVFKNLRDKVLERLLEQQNILFYGSFAMQKFSPPPLEDFTRKVITMDIDVASDNPEKLCDDTFKYLTSVDVEHKFIFISEVKMVRKDDSLTSITLELRYKTVENTRGFVCLRSGMMDCTSISSWDLKSCFPIKEKVWCQNPLHYLAGIVDKLYNSQLNERISKGHRKGAEDNAMSKIMNLSIPASMIEHTVEGVISRSSITTPPLLLSTFFSHPKQTRESLDMLLHGKAKESIKIYLEWKSSFFQK